MKIKTLGLLLLITATLVGCGNNAATENTETKVNEKESGTETTGEWKPEKNITLVVPYEAGGNTDIPTRIIAKYMSEYSDTGVDITNIVGAGGRTGVKEVMGREADGYTYVLQSSGFAMQSALGVADFTYEDMEEVGYFLDSSVAIVVNADSPYKTLEDLVSDAKEKEGQIKLGSVGGTIPFFAGLYLEEQNGISFNKVDLDGAAKATELLSSRIEAYIDGFGSVKQYVDSGDFRCLAVISDMPIQGYEDIPTLKDLEYTGYEYLKQIFGIWAPKGTDEKAIEYLNGLMKQASENEDCISELNEICYNVYYTTPGEHSEILKQIYSDYSEAAKTIIK